MLTQKPETWLQFIDKDKDEPLLHAAVKNCNIEAVYLILLAMIKANVPIDKKDAANTSALTIATEMITNNMGGTQCQYALEEIKKLITQAQNKKNSCSHLQSTLLNHLHQQR